MRRDDVLDADLPPTLWQLAAIYGQRGRVAHRQATRAWLQLMLAAAISAVTLALGTTALWAAYSRWLTSDDLPSAYVVVGAIIALVVAVTVIYELTTASRRTYRRALDGDQQAGSRKH